MNYKIIEKGKTSLYPIVFEVDGVHGHVEIKNQSGNAIDQFVMRGEHLLIRCISFYDKETRSHSASLTITNKDSYELELDKEYPYCETTPGIIFSCFDRAIKLYMGDATSVPTMPTFAVGSEHYGFSVPVCEYVVDVSEVNEIVNIGYDLDLSIFQKIIFRDRDYFQNINFTGVAKWDIYGENEKGQMLISSGCNDTEHQAYINYVKLCRHIGVTPDSQKQKREYRELYNLK